MDRARAGDPRAFRAMVETHQARVFALALRLLGNEADAMELTQDVFVAAWQGIGRFRGDSSISTWLSGIAVRRAHHLWRSAARRAGREDHYAREQTWAASMRRAMPEASMDLERAIRHLPTRMRAALVLHCIEGFPQRTVAELMGISEGAVKAHVHQARVILKKRLEP